METAPDRDSELQELRKTAFDHVEKFMVACTAAADAGFFEDVYVMLPRLQMWATILAATCTR